MRSPRNSPSPPYGEDPYTEFLGEFLYSTEFVNTYLSMLPGSKYVFETGRILEDIIFHSVRSTGPNSKWIQNNPILRWILDLDDEEVRRWFSRAERAELMSLGPQLPPCDSGFEYAVGRFPKVRTVTSPLPLPPSVNLLTLHRFRNPSTSYWMLRSPHTALLVSPMWMPSIPMPRTATTLQSPCLFSLLCQVCPQSVEFSQLP